MIAGLIAGLVQRVVSNSSGSHRRRVSGGAATISSPHCPIRITEHSLHSLAVERSRKTEEKASQRLLRSASDPWTLWHHLGAQSTCFLNWLPR